MNINLIFRNTLSSMIDSVNPSLKEQGYELLLVGQNIIRGGATSPVYRVMVMHERVILGSEVEITPELGSDGYCVTFQTQPREAQFKNSPVAAGTAGHVYMACFVLEQAMAIIVQHRCQSRTPAQKGETA